MFSCHGNANLVKNGESIKQTGTRPANQLKPCADSEFSGNSVPPLKLFQTSVFSLISTLQS